MGGYDKTGCLKDNEAYGAYWNGGANELLIKNSCCAKNVITEILRDNIGYNLRTAADGALSPRVMTNEVGYSLSELWSGSSTDAALGIPEKKIAFYTHYKLEEGTWATKDTLLYGVTMDANDAGINAPSSSQSGVRWQRFCNNGKVIATGVAGMATLYISLA